MESVFVFTGAISILSRLLADILACVRELERENFTLVDIYKFENRLAQLLPKKLAHPSEDPPTATGTKRSWSHRVLGEEYLPDQEILSL
jgi:hypothetical protein